MIRKSRLQAINISFLVKTFIAAFLFIFLYAFVGAVSPRIVLINFDEASASGFPWQERRLLAEIIKCIAADKPKAIVVTLPCRGFTSAGADRMLLNAVKEAGCVYFGLSAWDALRGYAKGIGHLNFTREKDKILIENILRYENSDYPALSILLLKEFFDKTPPSKFSFRTSETPVFKEYRIKDVYHLKNKGLFKDKICFLGNRKLNILQAAAVYALISGNLEKTKKTNHIVVACLLAGFLAITFALILRFKKIVRSRLPHKLGRLSFGESRFSAESNLCSLIGHKLWMDNRLWLWMADCSSASKKIKLFIGNFFESYKQTTGTREVMIRLNSEICKDRDNSFVNFIIMEIEPEKGIVTFSKAGFESPLLFVYSTKEFRDFPEDEQPLGLRRNADFNEQKIILEKSDILFLFNSGIVGSRDREGRFIDLEQLKYIITQNSALSTHQLTRKILRVILDFNRGRPGADMMFLAIKAD